MRPKDLASKRTMMKCRFCDKDFVSVPRAGRPEGRSLFCSPSCAAKNRSKTATWKKNKKVCNGCGKEKDATAFRAKRLTCKSCESEQHLTRRYEAGIAKACAQCGNIFQAIKRGSGFNLYCSKTCADAAKVKRTEYKCLNCKAAVLRPPETNRVFCSVSCRTAYSIGPNNPSWRGGIIKRDGAVSVYVGKRKGFVSNSWPLHRVVASSVIGRQLTHDEHVIHIDNNKSNNSPSNLFVCESKSEWRRRILGVTLPWPKYSNLDELRICEACSATTARAAG